MRFVARAVEVSQIDDVLDTVARGIRARVKLRDGRSIRITALRDLTAIRQAADRFGGRVPFAYVTRAYVSFAV